MPALSNARWERFAQAIVTGLAGETRLEQAQSTAYRNAGYLAKEGNSAEASASRLLRRVKPILDRVRELQERSARKVGRSVETIAERMALASQIAEEDRNPSALYGAEAAIAKVLGLQVDRQEIGQPGDFTSAQSSHDLADMMIRQANPGIGSITDDMRESALAELGRHASAMEAIARGTSNPIEH